MLHIYCGNGKGKTTAALGLALRASGNNMRVHIVQLLKGAETSELNALKNIDKVTVSRLERDFGFTFCMTDEEKNEVTRLHNELLLEAKKLSGEVDLLIIDEFNGAYECNLLDKELADSLILDRPEGLEMVITGYNPDKKFLEVADYVSEIKCVKHPYDKGVNARKGIEY